ncbi:MFS transporter [Steroidobacter sp.]|uniref:MFS transporter n=1 Tax=Steroidobacter sp. TaxID=1978227 RepID=UPI001A4A6654|nr:MFS transporter [Steroidobacter sp.]MBL8265803.1 MFS transporter [Steroidobacter sp.]
MSSRQGEMQRVAAQPMVADSTRTGYRWIVLGIVFVLYTAAFADRANIGIALPYIRSEFGLTNTQTGLIVSLFAFAYALGQVPAAFMVRALGTRIVVPTALLLTSAVTAAIGFAGSVVWIKVCRVALGLAEAPLAIGMVTTINNWFPAREKGTAAGIFIAATKFGPLIVPPLGALIIVTLGWRYVFFFCAIPGLLLAVVWYWFVRDDPAGSRFCNREEVDYIKSANLPVAHSSQVAARTEGRRFRWLDTVIRTRQVEPMDTPAQIFRCWSIWGAAIAYFFMQGIVGVILAWLPVYLVEVKHFSIMKVGYVAAAPFAGAVFGNLLGGWLSDRWFNKRRKPTMLITCASTVVMMYSLTAAPNDAVVLALLLFVTGVLLSVGYSAYSIYPSRMTTKKAFPVATSLLNTGGQFGTASIPFLTGVILDSYSWNVVFIFLAACSLLALCFMCSIIEPVEPGTAG